MHKITTALSKTHAMVVVEDLNVSGMTKSAKGTVNNPGKNVKAKSGLNREILNHGWTTFKNMLEYKQYWQGGEVIKVNPAYTSQQCPKCGYTDSANRLTQSEFKCQSCHHEQHVDWVGAQNILAAGHAVQAVEGKELSPLEAGTYTVGNNSMPDMSDQESLPFKAREDVKTMPIILNILKI